MKLTQIHEARYANQITGIYVVSLTRHSSIREKVRQPLYDKANQVLLMHFTGTPQSVDTSVKIAVFGDNPYQRLRQFVEQFFGEELDDHDFGVSSILDKSRNYPRGKNPFMQGTFEKHFKQVYDALERAKQI